MKADRGEENPWYSWRIQIGNFPRKPTFYHRSNSPCCWVVFPHLKSALTASKYLHWRDPNFARRWHSYEVQNAVRFNVLQWTTLPLDVQPHFAAHCIGRMCLCTCNACTVQCAKYACAPVHSVRHVLCVHYVQSPFPFPHFSPLLSKSCQVLPFLNAKFLQYKSWCGFEKSIERLKRLSRNLIIN